MWFSNNVYNDLLPVCCRSDPRYHKSLGYAVMQIAKAVPNGMLVFFPSYSIMKMVLDSWQVRPSPPLIQPVMICFV